MESKAMLRQTVRERAALRDDAWRSAASRHILSAVERMEEFAAARAVVLYWSLPGEVCTHAFAGRWMDAKRIYLPVMQGDGLALRRFTGVRDLREARFGVMEPVSDEQIAPSGAGLIVVPGVGFDPQGNRLGHGKGFYDRLLAAEGALRVGVCFGYQLFECLPAGPLDVPVDRVVCGTEIGADVYRRNRNPSP